MKHLSAISCCLFIAALLLLVGTASAATRTWDGSNSVNWNLGANWAGNTVPGNNDDVFLTGAGTYRPTNQNLGSLTLKSLTFDATTTNPFTLSGSSITFATGAGTDLTVASGAAGHTISCNIAMTNTQTWAQGSANPFTISGVISGASNRPLTKTGTGTLIFSGANSYTGTTTVSTGTLSLGDGVATGNIIPAANLITNNAALIYNTPSTITHSGVISGTGTFQKSGSGTLTLSGANSYTGATTVGAGELQFNGINTGTSTKTVSSRGTLAGSGTIRGPVTVGTGSTIRGGTGSGSAGTLTITSGTGTLTFSGLSSSLSVTSDGTSLSRVSVGTNTITENSGMTVNLLDPMPAGTYTLISKTSAGLPTTLPTLGTNNSGKTAIFAWVSGTGLIVTLTPVPVVTGILPDSGPIAGGTSVIITGTGFTGASSVKFGTTANATGEMTVNSDTQITVTSPAHAAGTVDVTVTNPSGTSATSSADQFTFVEPSVAITLNENSINLPFAVGSSATDSSLVITTTASVPFVITIADTTGRSTNQGYMGSYTGSAYDSGGPDLQSYLQLAGTTTGSTTAQTITGPITSAAKPLYSGSAAVNNQNLPTLFTQPVAYTDRALPSGSIYRINLMFVIQAS